MSKVFFCFATVILCYGVTRSIELDKAIGGIGTMSMNSYYILAIALYVASVACELIWPTRQQ